MLETVLWSLCVVVSKRGEVGSTSSDLVGYVLQMVGSSGCTQQVCYLPGWRAESNLTYSQSASHVEDLGVAAAGVLRNVPRGNKQLEFDSARLTSPAEMSAQGGWLGWAGLACQPRCQLNQSASQRAARRPRSLLSHSPHLSLSIFNCSALGSLSDTMLGPSNSRPWASRSEVQSLVGEFV